MLSPLLRKVDQKKSPVVGFKFKKSERTSSWIMILFKPTLLVIIGLRFYEKLSRNTMKHHVVKNSQKHHPLTARQFDKLQWWIDSVGMMIPLRKAK
jgi:hypothetical protein